MFPTAAPGTEMENPVQLRCRQIDAHASDGTVPVAVDPTCGQLGRGCPRPAN